MYGEPLPVAQTAPPRRSSVGFWLLLIGSIVLLMVLMCAGAVGWTVTSFTKWVGVASEKVDGVFADVEQGQFANVYGTKFSSAYRKVATPQQHAEMGEACQRGLGRLTSKTMQTMNRVTMNGKGCIVAIYNGQFEKGQGTIKVTLVWEDGDWKFQEFRVQSQALAATMKCPNCGAPHGLDAKFCPKCGKEILGGK